MRKFVLCSAPLLVSLLFLGCDDAKQDGDTGLGHSFEPKEDSGGGDNANEDGDEGDDGSGFAPVPDMGDGGGECDPRERGECPDGSKCTAVGEPPTPWGQNVCIEIGGQGVAGDPCDLEEHKYSGKDGCGDGLICMLSQDDGANGICVEFCNLDNECEDPSFTCQIFNQGVVPVCLKTCDPLAPSDCDDPLGCYRPREEFVCFSKAGEPGTGVDGDGCVAPNFCQPGLTCAAGGFLPDCAEENGGCCTPWCDITDDPSPCLGEEMCLKALEEGSEPPGLENLGVCLVPQG